MEIVLSQTDIDNLIKKSYGGVKNIIHKGKKIILEVDEMPRAIIEKPNVKNLPPPPSNPEVVEQPKPPQNVMSGGSERDRTIAFIG